MLSNGTHLFGNTVLLISLDGVRASYLDKGLTPNLLALSRKGLRAEYLQSIFPTLTFPNHWAIQTGLYAESHGIMANDFWDPSDETEFVYTDNSKSWLSKWWLGEPVSRFADFHPIVSYPTG
jgi:predicted AlkP superfamily pyrophosphatase or phosphodiesterase